MLKKPKLSHSIIVPERLEQMGCRKCHYLVNLIPQDDGTFEVECDRGRFHDPPHVYVEYETLPYHTPPPATECFEEWFELRRKHHLNI